MTTPVGRMSWVDRTIPTDVVCASRLHQSTITLAQTVSPLTSLSRRPCTPDRVLQINEVNLGSTERTAGCTRDAAAAAV